MVYIDKKIPPVGGRYHVQRGPEVYKILNVNTTQSPYIYKLMSLTTGKPLYGFYYGSEIKSANLSNLKIDKILKKKKRKDGKNLIKVRFKAHDQTFDRWQEE